MGESFLVGSGKPAQIRICAAVREAVERAIAAVRPGRSLNVIGQAVQAVADLSGYSIVRNLGSHGVGRSIHEEPSYVPFDNPREKRKLTEGMVFTIEPIFTTGHPRVEELVTYVYAILDDEGAQALAASRFMLARSIQA